MGCSGKEVRRRVVLGVDRSKYGYDVIARTGSGMARVE
jgi:hypothetical protein